MRFGHRWDVGRTLTGRREGGTKVAGARTLATQMTPVAGAGKIDPKRPLFHHVAPQVSPATADRARCRRTLSAMITELPKNLPPRYQPRRLLGRGAMGRVIEAIDRETGQPVAIKLLGASGSAERRLLEGELRALLQLRHPGIVRVLDAGAAGEELYLAMELCIGTPLDRLAGSPLDLEGFKGLIQLGAAAAEALSAVHLAGLLHRDVKPANIFLLAAPADARADPRRILERPDSSLAIKLLDFGLARGERQQIARLRSVEGTPLYMAPEQARGNPGVRSDLYSLGATLYHLATGQPPHRSLTSVLSGRSPRPAIELAPACPEQLSGLLERLLSPEPHERPASAADLREELVHLLSPGQKAHVEAPRLLPPTFTGRQEAVASLRRAIAEAASGHGSCVRVSGPRGSGKTWALRESGLVCQAFAEHGIPSLRTTFPREGAAADVLRQTFEQVPAGAETAGPLRGALEALQAWAHGSRPTSPEERGSAGDPASDKVQRDRVVAAAGELLRTFARTPFLWIVEDLEHADEVSFEIIGRFSRQLGDLPAAVIVSHRPLTPGASDALTRWCQEVAQEPWSRSLELGSLSEGEVAQVAARSLYPPGTVDPSLVRTLVEQSEGTPLLVVRRLQALWDQGRVQRSSAGVWRVLASDSGPAAGGVPWNNTLTHLAPDELRLLGAASVLGTVAEPAVLAQTAAAGGIPAGLQAVLPALARLAGRGLLSAETEGYSPAPDLEDGEAGALALRGALGEEQIRRMHAAAAAALLAPGASIAAPGLARRVARHLDAAGEPERAGELHAEAGRAYARAFLNLRAVESFRLALERTQDPATLGRLEEELGDALVHAGDPREARAHYGRALELQGRRINLLDKLGRALHRQGDLPEAQAAYSECLKLSVASPRDRALALLRLGGLEVERGEAAAAVARLEESLGLSRTEGDLQLTARVQFSLGVAEKILGRLEAAGRRLEEALLTAEAAGSLVEAATILNNLGNVYRALGDDQRAFECLQRSLEARERMGDRQGLGIVYNNLSRVHAVRGELDQSLTAAERALQIFGEVGDKKGVAIVRSNLAESLFLRGEFARARNLLGTAELEARRLKLPRLAAAALVTFAYLELDHGEYAAAEDRARAALRELPEEPPLELRAQGLGALAASRLAQGDSEGAQDALREALEIARELKLRGKAAPLRALEMRLLLQRGAAEEALTLRQSLAEEEEGMDTLSRALLHLETGKAYRELGPDWADRTQEQLEAAIRLLEGIPCPVQAALAHAEYAVYWRLLGEEAAATAHFARAEATLLAVGARKRHGELLSLKEAAA